MIVNQHNAILTYKQITPIIDENNPFKEPELEETTYEFKASIEQVKAEDIDASVGAEQSTIFAQGRLVLPRYFPSFVNLQRSMGIRWEMYPGKWVDGRAIIRPQIISRLNLQHFFGEKIQLEMEIDL